MESPSHSKRLRAVFTLLNDNESGSTRKYEINLTYGRSDAWKVVKNQKEVENLLEEMKTICPELTNFEPSPTDVERTETEALEVKFNDLLAYYDEEVWSVEAMSSFVDNAPVKSIVRTIQVRRLNQQIYDLQQNQSELESKYHFLETKFSQLWDLVQDNRSPSKVGDLASRKSFKTAADDDEFLPLAPPSLYNHVRNNASPHSHQRNPNRLSFLSAVTTDSAVTVNGTETSSNFQSQDQNDFSDEEEALIRASFVSWDGASGGGGGSGGGAGGGSGTPLTYNDDAASTVAQKDNFYLLPKSHKEGIVPPPSLALSANFGSLSPLFPSINEAERVRTSSASIAAGAELLPDGIAAVFKRGAAALADPVIARSASAEDKQLHQQQLQQHDSNHSSSSNSLTKEGKSSHEAGLTSFSLPSPPKGIPMEIYPRGEQLICFATGLNDIFQSIEPNETQVLYRASAIGFLQKQVRLALQVNGFDISLNALHCVLPDDPIKLSVMLSKNQATNWHITLTDRMNLVSERGGGSYVLYPDEEDSGTAQRLSHIKTAFDGNVPLIPHFISNIAHSKQNLNHQVHCVIDSLEVEIVCNNRIDVCMLAFMEEVAELVGQDNLFKRSLLLIRAWWYYETTFYVGCAIKHYFSTAALCVMVCSVFNQHHAQITSPLQALWLFLMEYSHYDPVNQAITLQGLVPYQTGMDNRPCLVPPQVGHLIQAEVIDKYWQYFNIAAVSADIQEAENEAIAAKTAALAAAAAAAVAAAGAAGGEENSEVAGLSTASASNASASVAALVPPASPSTSAAAANVTLNNNDYYNTMQSSIVLENKEAIIKNCISKLAASNLFYFDRQQFSIVHPFTNINIIDKLTQRRLARLAKAFEIGAANLNAILKQQVASALALESSSLISALDGPVPSATDLIRSFFPCVLGRFADHWRPDAINNSIVISDRYYIDFPRSFTRKGKVFNRYAVNANKLWEIIIYCNLMLESVISESALSNLAMEILAIKGSLPVGEIGKILAEWTSISNLSQRLKEKFGGLKKFLEHFPANFVIFNDHPFNPNVLLRQALSQENRDLIDKGIFPHQALAKSKKSTAAKKKSKSLSIPGGSNSNAVGYNTEMNASSSIRQQQQAKAIATRLPSAGGGASGSGAAQSQTSNSYSQLRPNQSLKAPVVVPNGISKTLSANTTTVVSGTGSSYAQYAALSNSATSPPGLLSSSSNSSSAGVVGSGQKRPSLTPQEYGGLGSSVLSSGSGSGSSNNLLDYAGTNAAYAGVLKQSQQMQQQQQQQQQQHQNHQQMDGGLVLQAGESNNVMLSNLRNGSLPLRHNSLSSNNLIGSASSSSSFYNLGSSSGSPRHSQGGGGGGGGMKSIQPELMHSGSPPKMTHSDSYHSFFEDPYHHQQNGNVGLNLQQPQMQQQQQQQFFDNSGRSLGMGGGRNSFSGNSRSDQFLMQQQQQQQQQQHQQHHQNQQHQQGMGYSGYGSPNQRSHY